MGEEVTDDEELAALNGGGSDDAELAKLNGASTSVAPAPRSPTLTGTESPSDLAAKLAKAWPHESPSLPTPAKSDAQREIDEDKTRNDTGQDFLRNMGHRASYGLSEVGSERRQADLDTSKTRSPTASKLGDLAGMFLAPLPGAAAAAQGAFMGVGNSLADTKTGKVPDFAQAGREGLAGLLGGHILGRAGQFGKALESRGSELANKAMSRVEEEALANRDSSLASTRGMSGRKTGDYFANEKRLQDSLSNPLADPELAAQAKEKLASEEARFAYNRALKNALENHSRLGPAIEEADLAHATNQAFWTPEQLKARQQEILDKSGLASGVLEVGKRVVPSLVGGALGNTLGHELTGGLLGTAVGAVSGKPGTILKNRMALPGFQKSLGEAQQSIGRGISTLAQKSGGGGQALVRPGARSLAEYLDLLKQKEETP